MSELKKYIIDQLIQLVPNADTFEVRVNVSDKSFAIEFFAVVEGVKHQCYDMIDNGIIREKDFDIMVKQLAKYIRTCRVYCPEELNKFAFTENI